LARIDRRTIRQSCRGHCCCILGMRRRRQSRCVRTPSVHSTVCCGVMVSRLQKWCGQGARTPSVMQHNYREEEEGNDEKVCMCVRVRARVHVCVVCMRERGTFERHTVGAYTHVGFKQQQTRHNPYKESLNPQKPPAFRDDLWWPR
jgi:hypothetical protein